MANIALLGAGYIAQRHIDAIRQTNNRLVLFYDHVEELKGNVKKASNESDFFQQLSSFYVDYVSICTPSYQHFEQIKRAFEQGCNAIVEKPICLTLGELEQIQQLEQQTGRKAYSLFQLRYHELYNTFPVTNEQEQIQIIYQGKRNEAYHQSWKGNLKQSGGITCAVGIHYFDLLTNRYGSYINDSLHMELVEKKHVKGVFELERAKVAFNFEFLPQDSDVVLQRLFMINNQEFDFSSYATNLHTLAYEQIINGGGISTAEAKQSLQLVEAINEYLL